MKESLYVIKHSWIFTKLIPQISRLIQHQQHYPGCMGSGVIRTQDGGGMLTSSIRRAHGVRTKVGRLQKHSVLKSDWFSVKLVILTCRKNK